MSPKIAQVYSGPDAARAADAVRKQRANQENWPYPYVYPPPDALPVQVITLTPVAVPAAAGTVVVLQYQVPSGFHFVMQGIVTQIQGGVTPMPWGAGLWTVDVNAPLGVANKQATPVHGLTAIPAPLGSFGGPWIFQRAYEFEALDIIRSKFTNVSYADGLPNVLMSAFVGYLVPSVKSR